MIHSPLQAWREEGEKSSRGHACLVPYGEDALWIIEQDGNSMHK